MDYDLYVRSRIEMRDRLRRFGLELSDSTIYYLEHSDRQFTPPTFIEYGYVYAPYVPDDNV